MTLFRHTKFLCDKCALLLFDCLNVSYGVYSHSYLCTGRRSHGQPPDLFVKLNPPNGRNIMPSLPAFGANARSLCIQNYPCNMCLIKKKITSECRCAEVLPQDPGLDRPLAWHLFLFELHTYLGWHVMLSPPLFWSKCTQTVHSEISWQPIFVCFLTFFYIWMWMCSGASMLPGLWPPLKNKITHRNGSACFLPLWIPTPTPKWFGSHLLAHPGTLLSPMGSRRIGRAVVDCPEAYQNKQLPRGL